MSRDFNDVIDDYEDIDSNDKKIRKKKLKENKKKLPRKEKIIRVVAISLIVASVLAIGGVWAANHRWWGEIVPPDLKHSDELKEKTVNFLICGIDSEEGRTEMNSDIMMVANIDVVNKKMSILQLPRDTWVGGEETPYGKLNGVFARSESGGIKGLMRFLNTNYKLSIDHYATVTMDTFMKVVDDVGGVEMDVPSTISWEGVTIQKGKQKLSGRQAQIFVRKRKGADVAYDPLYQQGDISRMKMQRLFLAALADELQKCTLDEYVKLVQTAMKNVKTDLNVAEVLKYAKFVREINLKKMTIDILPGSAVPESLYPFVNGLKQSVYSVDKQQAVELLNKRFRLYTDPLPETAFTILEIEGAVTQFDNDTSNNLKELTKDGAIPGQKKEKKSSSKNTSSGTR